MLRAADTAGAYRVASEALAEGLTPAALYQRVITPAMYELGVLWEKGAITIADEHLATALTERVLAALRADQLKGKQEGGSEKPRAMLATVQGEQHTLGLRMAVDLLEERGFEPVYLGADVPTDSLLQALAALSPDLLGLSATMPASGRRLEDVLAAVNGRHPRLQLLVGGQAIASRQLRGATPVYDLERLGRAMDPP